ncbi:hypothetical protein SUGI_0167030 [Cryptomeria japonica]|nr:hypothetical protein SUGI_0167030 [Cryptomeria japonica]
MARGLYLWCVACSGIVDVPGKCFHILCRMLWYDYYLNLCNDNNGYYTWSTDEEEEDMKMSANWDVTQNFHV